MPNLLGSIMDKEYLSILNRSLYGKESQRPFKAFPGRTSLPGLPGTATMEWRP